MPGLFTLVSSHLGGGGGGLQLNRDYEVNSEYGGNLPSVLALISSKFKIAKRIFLLHDTNLAYHPI